MPLKDLLRKKSHIESSGPTTTSPNGTSPYGPSGTKIHYVTESLPLRPAPAGVGEGGLDLPKPEFTFKRTTTTSEENICLPSFPGDDEAAEQAVQARWGSSAGRTEERTEGGVVESKKHRTSLFRRSASHGSTTPTGSGGRFFSPEKQKGANVTSPPGPDNTNEVAATSTGSPVRRPKADRKLSDRISARFSLNGSGGDGSASTNGAVAEGRNRSWSRTSSKDRVSVNLPPSLGDAPESVPVQGAKQHEMSSKGSRSSMKGIGRGGAGGEASLAEQHKIKAQEAEEAARLKSITAEREAAWEERATKLALSSPRRVGEHGTTTSPPQSQRPQLRERAPTHESFSWEKEGGHSRSSSTSEKDGSSRPATAQAETDEQVLQRAITLHESGDLESSTALFAQLADPQGPNIALAQVLYGLALRHGWGVVVAPDKAIDFLSLAASNSASTEALALSAGMQTGGAAKGELVLAMFELANCFRHGWGVKRDPIAARMYYETAANLGDADACEEVSWCYIEAFGGAKDKFKAARYLRLAEQHGKKAVGNSWIWKEKYDA